jgi:hypothetical protein
MFRSTWRIVYRTVCLLLVAGVVAGGLSLIADAQGSAGSGQRVERTERERGGGPPDGPRSSGVRRPGGHGEPSLGQGLGGVVETIVKVGVIAAVVVLLQRWSRRRRDARRPGSCPA